MVRASHIGSPLVPGPGFDLARLTSTAAAWATRVRNEIVFADLGFGVLRRPQLRSSAGAPLVWDGDAGVLVFLDGDLFQYDVRSSQRSLVCAADGAPILIDNAPPVVEFGEILVQRSDGQRVVVLPHDRQPEVVWITAGGAATRRITLPRGATLLAVDARQTRILVCSGSSDLELLDRSGVVLSTLRGSNSADTMEFSRVWSASLDAAGERAVVGVAEGLVLWTCATGELTWLDRGASCNPSWSPSGDGSIVYAYGGSELRVIDPATSSSPRVVAHLEDGIDPSGRSFGPPSLSNDGRFVCAPLLECRSLPDGSNGLGPVAVVADLRDGRVSRVDLPLDGTVWIGDAKLPLAADSSTPC